MAADDLHVSEDFHLGPTLRGGKGIGFRVVKGKGGAQGKISKNLNAREGGGFCPTGVLGTTGRQDQELRFKRVC